jgi:peptide/nickel transport system permease protein
MARLLARNLGLMLLMMATLSFIVFVAVEWDPNRIAANAIPQSSAEQRLGWLKNNNYLALDEAGEIARDAAGEPVYIGLFTRYFRWMGRTVGGDFGYSARFKVPVGDLLWKRLGNTAILAGLTMALMVPLALLFGILAGMREGSTRDRALSVAAIISTSVPEFASAVIAIAVFVFWLEWLPGTSAMIGGFDWKQIIMPVGVLVIYGAGYIARITRASMAEVMNAPFIRTAILKGLPYKKVVLRHALRNALITPVTVIMLQFPWLLSGVIVVESAFAYKGFGTLLLDAAEFNDSNLIEACTLVTVAVVVATQVISDIIYTYLNPRIRFQ